MAISLRLAAAPTDSDILQLSERNPGLQFERTAAGELVVTPNGTEGGGREAELLGQLYVWAGEDGTGKVFGPSTGFRLPDGSVFAPDASWVRLDRWEGVSRVQRKKFAPLCPDAVFEIASESDTLAFLRRKMRTYVANGARLGVLIDPEHATVEVSMAGRDPQVFESADTVSLDPILPGFTLNVRLILA